MLSSVGFARPLLTRQLRLTGLAPRLAIGTSCFYSSTGSSRLLAPRASVPGFQKHQQLTRYFSSQKPVVDAKAAAASSTSNETPSNLKKQPSKPFSLTPYLALSRIDKPIGSWLLYWPCAWSLTLAAQTLQISPGPLLFNLSIFGIGAFIMRGAGCTINDMWDSKMDRLVDRTKARPLAAGDVSYLQAWTFLGLQLSVGLGILLQLNWYSILLGASSLGVVIIYPLMKRITHWPQLVLGLAFNWGALLGWSALSAPPAWSVVLPLYAGSICWTLVYDTIYAHQDKKDDIGAGVKSTALLFGDYSRSILTAFSIGFVSLLTKAVATTGPLLPSSMDTLFTTGHPFFLLSLVPIVSHLTWQIKTVDFNSRADCWSKFVSNQYLGLIVWVGLMLDWLVQMGPAEQSQEEEKEEIKVVAAS